MTGRLIDADMIELLYLTVPIAPIIKGTDVHYETVAFKEAIDELPTAEAIPIAFLEDRANTYEALQSS